MAAPAQGGYPNTSNFSQPPDKDAAWYQRCLRVQHRQPPARDLARTAPRNGKACKAPKLYYDKLHQAATTKAEWDQVRHCAVASADTSVLMMLASGDGSINVVFLDVQIRFRMLFIFNDAFEPRGGWSACIATARTVTGFTTT